MPTPCASASASPTADTPKTAGLLLPARAKTPSRPARPLGLLGLAYFLLWRGDGSKPHIAIGICSAIGAIGALLRVFQIPSEARQIYREAPEIVAFGAPADHRSAVRASISPVRSITERDPEKQRGGKARARIDARRTRELAARA
ncbi:MAG: hypothetical protein U0414_02600 [Polyangiaceae bacterium]